MPTTALGIWYPDDSDSMELWAHFADMADSIETIIQALKGSLEDEWETYTPDWGARTTDPTIGNGTLTGRYRRVGYTVDMIAVAKCGSTTTAGEGFYSLSLPFPPRTGLPEQRLHCEVRANIESPNPAPRWKGDIRLVDDQPDLNVAYDSTGSGDGRVVRIGHDGPIAGLITEGTEFTVWGTYETASAP